MNLQILTMFVVIGGLIFWMSRSQKKQAEKRMESLSRLNKGDEVITVGGLYGVVDEVDLENKRVVLDIDGIYLTFELGAIRTVLPTTDSNTEAVETSDVVENETTSINED